MSRILDFQRLFKVFLNNVIYSFIHIEAARPNQILHSYATEKCA